MLKQRMITGVIMGIVFIVSLFFLPWYGFGILITGVLAVGGWEWAKLAGFTVLWQRVFYSVVLCTIVYLLLIYCKLLSENINVDGVRQLLVATAVWWAIALLWIQGYPSSVVLWGNRWLRALMGLIVLAPAGVALIFLSRVDHGPWLILLVVLLVFAADTGAYFSGTRWGKHKLAPSVSPGKSWEGFCGGLVGCLLVAVLLTAFVKNVHWAVVVSIVVATALASVVGDLLESMVKRHCGVKDSGRILPGHGGILDRMDSLSAAVPIFALGITLSGWGIS